LCRARENLRDCLKDYISQDEYVPEVSRKWGAVVRWQWSVNSDQLKIEIDLVCQNIVFVNLFLSTAHFFSSPTFSFGFHG
jgi:hypothetical protein